MISTPKPPQTPKRYMDLVVLQKIRYLRVESTLCSMRPFTEVPLIFFVFTLFQHCVPTNQGNLSLSPMKQFSYSGLSRTHLLQQINFKGVFPTLNDTSPKKISSEYSFLNLITHAFQLLSSFSPAMMWKTILFF